MKSFLEVKAHAAATFLCATIAFITVSAVSGKTESAPVTPQASQLTAEGEASIDDLRSSDLWDAAGARIGTIEDIVIDSASGRALFALARLEQPAKRTAIPFGKLYLVCDESDSEGTGPTPDPDWFEDCNWHLNATSSALALAPEIPTAEVEQRIRDSRSEIEDAFGQPGGKDWGTQMLLLASQITSARIADGDGRQLKINRLLVDARGNGKATYLMDERDGSARRLSLSSLEWSSPYDAVVEEPTPQSNGPSAAIERSGDDSHSSSAKAPSAPYPASPGASHALQVHQQPVAPTAASLRQDEALIHPGDSEESDFSEAEGTDQSDRR